MMQLPDACMQAIIIRVFASSSAFDIINCGQDSHVLLVHGHYNYYNPRLPRAITAYQALRSRALRSRALQSVNHRLRQSVLSD